MLQLFEVLLVIDADTNVTPNNLTLALYYVDVLLFVFLQNFTRDLLKFLLTFIPGVRGSLTIFVDKVLLFFGAKLL
jgi:hypothetical protein